MSTTHTTFPALTRRRRSVGSSVRKCAALALALAAVLPAVASARTVTYQTGQPGYSEGDVTYGWINENGLNSTGTVASGYVRMWRSPAFSGSQTLELTRRIWYWDGNSQTWNHYDSLVNRATIASGSVTFNRWDRRVWLNRAYHTALQLRWYTSGGSHLATQVVDLDRLADYRCLHTYPNCNTYYLGGYAAMSLQY